MFLAALHVVLQAVRVLVDSKADDVLSAGVGLDLSAAQIMMGRLLYVDRHLRLLRIILVIF